MTKRVHTILYIILGTVFFLAAHFSSPYPGGEMAIPIITYLAWKLDMHILTITDKG